jgi:hypothetical protein
VSHLSICVSGAKSKHVLSAAEGGARLQLHNIGASFDFGRRLALYLERIAIEAAPTFAQDAYRWL